MPAVFREYGYPVPGRILDEERVLEVGERPIQEADPNRPPLRKVAGRKTIPIFATCPADVVADELLKPLRDRPPTHDASGKDRGYPNRCDNAAATLDRE